MEKKRGTNAVLLAALLVAASCARVTTPAPAPGMQSSDATPPAQRAAPPALAAAMRERTRASVPAAPRLAEPGTRERARLWQSALKARGLRIVVGTEARALWLMRDSSVLFRAPVAVGKTEGFEYRGISYDFTTPVGQRKVQRRDTMPVWVPPDWHYFELAVERDLEPVQLRADSRIRLSDSTMIAVREGQVGRINTFGNFWPFTPGTEIIFDGKIFIPPFGTAQRQIPKVLGTHKLELGDGYLIHGTDRETSIGDPVSHGCVRMYNEDVAQLYELVPDGTPVFIY